MNKGEKFLKLSEMYLSVQGEGIHTGLPCFFIRTAGCDLRCRWCDTPQALSGGKWFSRDEILNQIPENIPLIQITGGEPMLQSRELVPFMKTLTENPWNKKILLETGGHRDLKDVPESVHIVMDIKLPGSGESEHDFETNIIHLKKTDEIKFVIADRVDFEKAADWIERLDFQDRAGILFSPVWGQLESSVLADWILKNKMNVRLQIQLHKLIWGPDKRGV